MGKGESSSGISFLGALQLIFTVLKLLKLIEWSWWWVLSPTWISILTVIVLIIYMKVKWG